MNDATLKGIIKLISNGSCVAILGPNLIDPAGRSIHTLLNQHLADNLGNKVRHYEEKGFLSFDTTTREIFIEDEVKDFFESLEPNELYRKIAEIPFSIVINTSPDITLNKILKEKGIGFDYDFYNMGNSSEYPVQTQARFIYNIFGDYRELNSMVLTYRDMYQYMQSIMGNKGLKIKSVLKNAKAVLFIGFSFDKWYFQLLLWLLDLEGKFLNSHDINQKDIKNFYHEELKVEFFENNTASQIIEDLYKAKADGLITEPKPPEIVPPELYISYAWREDSDEMADLLESTLKDNGFKLIRDKSALDYKDGITEFMNRIGEARGVVAVLSDKYLKSEYCMYELTEIYQNEDFKDRIFPIFLADAKLEKSEDRLAYKMLWKERVDELDQKIREGGREAVRTVQSQLDKRVQIFENFDIVTELLANMNALTPEIHKNTSFEKLIEKVQKLR